MPLIQEIDLTDGQLEFPPTLVGMVVAQPFTELTQTEPYRCLPEAVEGQLRAVARTLDISLERPHGQEKTHFTVFPEYSIPGRAGMDLVDQYIAKAEWPAGTVVIGGIDGLDGADYAALLDSKNSHVNAVNHANQLQHGEWVNCCVTWIKLSDGCIHRWIQPKITPAYPEAVLATQAMFRGKSVYIFKARREGGRIARFFTLVCFDWVGSIGEQIIWRSIAAEMEADAEHRRADSSSLTWTFVIQHNDKPNHTSFLEQIKGYFTQTQYPRLERNHACLVMVNRAGRKNPGSAGEYGSTAVVNSNLAGFFKQECPATFGSGGPRYRPNNQLENLSDCFFREAGACVHSFAQRNPQSVTIGAAAKTLSPVERAFVHAIEGPPDPRSPGGMVPCSLKLFHDELDQTRTLADAYPNASLAADAKTARQTLVAGYRLLDAPRLEAMTRLVSPELKAANNAERWGSALAPAMTLLSQAISVTGVVDAKQSFVDAAFHATSKIGDTEINIIAVRARSHEDSARHLSDDLPQSRIPIAVISRDEDNTDWIPEYGSFLSRHETGEGKENSITNPSATLRFIGYSTILEAYLRSATAEELSQELSNAIFE